MSSPIHGLVLRQSQLSSSKLFPKGFVIIQSIQLFFFFPPNRKKSLGREHTEALITHNCTPITAVPPTTRTQQKSSHPVLAPKGKSKRKDTCTLILLREDRKTPFSETATLAPSLSLNSTIPRAP